jgi:PAS domain S-box-containing protein
MNYSLNTSEWDVGQVLSQDGERVLRRAWRLGEGGSRINVLVVGPVAELPSRSILDRLSHEYELRHELDSAWAVKPLAFVHDGGRAMLVLQDPGGEPLEQLLVQPMETGRFLRLANSITRALGRLHGGGLVHKDIKPANIVVNELTGEAKLTGLGIASRLPHERQAPDPPDTIAGTLTYMAPEQTGRMNRSIDSRSDLYALGATFYEMLIGAPPFATTDPLELIHSHIARQPVLPHVRVTAIPEQVSSIIMKLLAKAPEERYQTAAGVEADLNRCLATWEILDRIDAFPLGMGDASDRLLIPERLYGREREVEALRNSFERVAASGRPELVLVSGCSGIGKSSVVNELHKILLFKPGLFAAGKFDQYKRVVPYSALADAFQDLIRMMLGRSEPELARWRGAITEALGQNAQLMVNLIPELESVIGPQPPVSELPPHDAQNRFQMAFRRFVGVFARSEDPFVLFLDDLQWADRATLTLIEHLIVDDEVKNVLLIGAYRGDEVEPSHPLKATLDSIGKAEVPINEIVLGPLGPSDLCRLVAEAFCCEDDYAQPLAQMVHDKTGGNPFFAIQFVTELVAERLVIFDSKNVGWKWNLQAIGAKGYADNVVDFVIRKLGRLPVSVLESLKEFACLGNVIDLTTLAMLHGKTVHELHAALGEAVRVGLIVRLDDHTYGFPHDRLQEASYSLIPLEERAAFHLRIGRFLASSIPPEKLEVRIFEVVDQLNRAVALITLSRERERLVQLNLLAGRRAMAANAHASALTYLNAAAALLPEDCWQQQYQAAFAVGLQRAECELLTSDLVLAEEQLKILSYRAASIVDQAAVACLRILLYQTLGESDRAVDVFLAHLSSVDIVWSQHPTRADIEQEIDQIWQRLANRSIETIADLPLMTAPLWQSTVNVLVWSMSPAMYTDENLLCLVAGRLVNLSLQYGNSGASCIGYVYVGALLGSRFANYESGYRFGKLGVDLANRPDFNRFKPRVDMAFADLVRPWAQHVGLGVQLLRDAFAGACDGGDFTCAAYCWPNLVTTLIANGDPLAEIQRQAELGLDFVRKVRFDLVAKILLGQLRLVRALRGLGGGYEGNEQEQELESNPRLIFAYCWILIRKLQMSFFAGDYSAALSVAAKAEPLLWTCRSFFEFADYHFYAALARAGSCNSASAVAQSIHLKALASHHRQLKSWEEHCSENFEDRAALVGAEIARIENREVDAMHLYEKAIRSARDNGFIHNEGVAYERASLFYRERGFDQIADVYLRSARYCYLRWGADGKVQQLDLLHPFLATPEESSGAETVDAAIKKLDVVTVVRASQAVSAEIELAKLIERLMIVALENAGADRGLLISPRERDYLVEAVAEVVGGEIVVRQGALLQLAVPESVIRYVVRTRESVILDDVQKSDQFAGDECLVRRQPRSVFCLPLVRHSAVTGVLYLENTLASHVFTPDRTALLSLLASQLAISLENTRLYHDLREREAKIRRLFDANVIGITVTDLEERMIEANDAFLLMVGYSREDLNSGRLQWMDLTPLEWHDRTLRAIADLQQDGTFQPYEKEYFRKDGSRVPVLVGGAAFGESRDQAVDFVVDLTERRRTEETLRELESNLAHMNRLSMMGELAASLAHEIAHPVAAALNNAQAALHFSDQSPPDLAQVREALGAVVDDSDRAGKILDRIRDHIKKAPPRKERVDLNQAITDVIALAQSAIIKNGVAVQTYLLEGRPYVEVDRVQVQQVILNLILNAVEAMNLIERGERELVISTEQHQAGGLLVVVRDSGPGIDQKYLDRVFDAFYTTKSSGVGMGLSICQSIINAHGGRLWASANAPQGAVFQFTLPDGQANS